MSPHSYLPTDVAADAAKIWGMTLAPYAAMEISPSWFAPQRRARRHVRYAFAVPVFASFPAIC